MYVLTVTAVPVTIWLISKYPGFSGSPAANTPIENKPRNIKVTLADYRAGSKISESVDNAAIALRTVAAEMFTLISTASSGILIPFLKTLLENLSESVEIEKGDKKDED